MKKILTMILYIATLSAILVGCGAPVGEEDGNNKGSNAEALKIAIKALEQEPFLNKPCVSEKICEHDKNVVLDKIRTEIDQKQYDFMDDKDYDEGIRFGLMLAYQIIDKYKAESEDK